MEEAGTTSPGTLQRAPPPRIERSAAVDDPLSYCPATYVPVGGNRVRLLHDGSEAFPAMLRAIEAARRSVYLEMYIYSDDATGRRFAEALAAAARRGVEVALLYDSLGSWRTHKWIFDWMRESGVKVLPYRPLMPWRRGWGWGRRDHRKILVVDGSSGFTGGHNIDDFWADENLGGAGWRDVMVNVEGPAAADLEALFREVWDREGKRQRRLIPLEPRREVPAPIEGEDGGGVQVSIVGNREFARRRAIRRAYRYAIARADRYIFIANPYFVPDHAILRALKRARRRGVRVALLLPGTSDIRSVLWASRASYEKLLSAGIEIYEWCKPMFHAKTAVIDGCWSTVGTYNLDTQSLRYNLEVTAVIPDRSIAAALERVFLEDVEQCERIELGEWRKRPWWWRIPEKFFYFFRAWL